MKMIPIASAFIFVALSQVAHLPNRTLPPGDGQPHAVTYMRLLDANAEGADGREVARIVLHIDPDREPDRARQAFESHLAHARSKDLRPPK